MSTPIDQILSVTLVKDNQFQRVTIANSIALLNQGWRVYNPPTTTPHPAPILKR